MSMPEMYLAHKPDPSLTEASSLWWSKALLENIRNALAESRAAVTTVISELAFCPNRSGRHGRNAAVLPSPDELKYAAGIVQRITLCSEHGMGYNRALRTSVL